MARKIKQFRFLERENIKTEEESRDDLNFIEPVIVDTSKEYKYSPIQESFIDGSIFKDCYPILQLGIQTLPGIRFKLNTSNDYAYIGHSGVFELDLKGQVEITKLQFYRESMRRIDENPSAYLIVDVVYEEGGM